MVLIAAVWASAMIMLRVPNSQYNLSMAKCKRIMDNSTNNHLSYILQKKSMLNRNLKCRDGSQADELNRFRSFFLKSSTTKSQFCFEHDISTELLKPVLRHFVPPVFAFISSCMHKNN